MKQLRFVILTLSVFISATILAQTGVEEHVASPTRNEVPPVRFGQPMMANSLQINTNVSFPELQEPESFNLLTNHDRTVSDATPTMSTPKPFSLWRGASVTVSGGNSQMQGLMDVATGAVSLHQDFGRLHLTGAVVANKYWMPMQSRLYTQYGFGGTLGYDLTNAVSLHAFGYYYANNPLVSPAFSPYVSTTSFGGYADVRFCENFGAEVGARRYVNPMSGKWTTSPIVTPYIRVGKRNKWVIGLPLGELLKAAVWGDQDNPMRFRPRPQSPQTKPQRR